jgi:hypothetical protein
MEKCKVISHAFGEIIEEKKVGQCYNCKYTGEAWFLKGENTYGLCDYCFKRHFSGLKIEYLGKEFPAMGLYIKISKVGNLFKVLKKTAPEIEGEDWALFGSAIVHSVFSRLITAKEFIKFIELEGPSREEIQVWLNRHYMR